MKDLNNIKEFFKNPKKKSLVWLGLYVIFFAFCAILIRSGESNNSNPIVEDAVKSPLEVYSEMTSYTYKVVYTNANKTDIIEGTYYNNISLFNYNNLKYYYNDSLYIIDNDSYYLSNIEYDITKIFNTNLYNIIDELEEESKTTYKDGKIVTNYIIDSNKIYYYLFGVESSYTNLSSISITEIDNEIINITVDLINLNIDLKSIDIEYSDINNIENIDFNIDNYTYKESL